MTNGGKLEPLYLGGAHTKRDDKIKPDGTPVGNLDIFSGERFKAIVQRRFPEAVFLAEENQRGPEGVARALADKESLICSIDGLEGTGNRGAGLFSYGSSVSLLRGEQITLGVDFLTYKRGAPW